MKCVCGSGPYTQRALYEHIYDRHFTFAMDMIMSFSVPETRGGKTMEALDNLDTERHASEVVAN